MSNTKKTILIVEDEPSYQHALVEKLGTEGFNVITTKNGEEGLAMALEKHPDLILLDLQMPKMDGIEMAKNIRADEWGKKAKVIILTNVSDMTKTQQALENEIFQYLVKTDIKIEDLVSKVKEFIK
jgi:DNA-binding response OmpR family regulator